MLFKVPHIRPPLRNLGHDAVFLVALIFEINLLLEHFLNESLNVLCIGSNSDHFNRHSWN